MYVMSLRKVIERHYSAFCEEVNPVELASCLNDLTMSDRDSIVCQSRSYGRDHANFELINAICRKVDWEDLYKALMKKKYRHLAKLLHEEYYKQNPTAPRIVYKEPFESQMAEGDMKCAEFIPAAPSSKKKTSSKIHSKDKISVSSSSCDKDSTSSKSQSLAPTINNITVYIRDINNSNFQMGDQNEIKYDKREEESVEKEDDTTYEIEIVPEVLENRSSSEIDAERPRQNIPGGQCVEQSIADDASQTSNLLSTSNSIVRSAACGERTNANGSQTLLKTSVMSEIECSQRIEEKATSDNNLSSYSTSAFKILGIEFRQNGPLEGENSTGNDEDETYVKKTMSED